MGIGDLFKASENAQLKEQIKSLTSKIAELEDMLSPEQKELESVSQTLKSTVQELDSLSQQKSDIENSISVAQEKLSDLQSQVIQTDEAILLQSFGLYEPHYDFANSSMYKDELKDVRTKQKTMIKSGKAVTGATDWTVNGSKSQGTKMVKDMQKLLLRAFNTECDELISKVKFNNIESMEERMEASCDAISKLGNMMNIKISSEYLGLKIDELYIAYEYAQKKQEEKEELKRIRAEQREQAKLEKEIEAERKKLKKEQSHCQNALDKLLKQDISSMSEDELSAYEAKKSELESHLGEIAKGIENVDYRAANQRAGYVYVISNIGAFGPDVYKIGMTRRLEPMDRVDELGDASVPFNFDVHAMIFSEDAPSLETALHNAFADRKVNMINTRREFFNVTLDEIKAVIKDNFDKTVEFVDVPPAEQFRESQLMRGLETDRSK